VYPRAAAQETNRVVKTKSKTCQPKPSQSNTAKVGSIEQEISDLRSEGRRLVALLTGLLGVEPRMDVFGSDAGAGYEMDGGPKTPEERAQVVEEFANYVDHGTIQALRITHLPPTDMRPITIADDATLSCLEHDWRVEEAVKATGHSFREILRKCQLILGGQPDYPDTWPIRWPCGFISTEHGLVVRAVLFLTWHPSADEYRDEDLKRRHAKAVDWMAHYVAGRHLTAEHRRRQAGGRAAAGSEVRNQNREAVIKAWSSLKNRPERDRASIIADRVGITVGQVRRLVKKAGLRPAQAPKVRP